jgi:hypothetical protein
MWLFVDFPRSRFGLGLTLSKRKVRFADMGGRLAEVVCVTCVSRVCYHSIAPLNRRRPAVMSTAQPVHQRIRQSALAGEHCDGTITLEAGIVTRAAVRIFCPFRKRIGA